MHLKNPNLFLLALLTAALTTALQAPILSGSDPAAAGDSADTAQTVLFQEPFEDTNWGTRGWYDGPNMLLDYNNPAQGQSSCKFTWLKAGDTTPDSRGARVLFEPVEGLTVSYYTRFSTDWDWTHVGYHPHWILFMTNKNLDYDGPAFTRLTTYVEPMDGKLLFGIQDGQNIDQLRIGQDLTKITEYRAVAGGNGDSDGYKGDYYRNGTVYWNGKTWTSDSLFYSDSPGPLYKGDWHLIRVHFQLNSLVDGKGVNNGVVRYWYDNQLIFEHHNILFHTGQFPEMRFNQFLLLPYFGPGVAHQQSIWIDDLKIVQEEEVLPLPQQCDINGDGKANILDVLSLLLKGFLHPGDTGLDRDGDGRYGAGDALTLLEDIVGGAYR